MPLVVPAHQSEVDFEKNITKVTLANAKGRSIIAHRQ